MYKSLYDKKIITFVFLFFTGYLLGQNASPIITEGNGTGADRSNCSAQSAGSIYFGNEAGFSNDIYPYTFFLCFGEEFYTFHNGDQDFSGDYDPGTPGGIGYAWYTAPPTATGPMLSDVKADPNLFPH